MKAKALIAIILATLIWGASFIAIKYTVEGISPGLLNFFRFLIATVLLLILCRGKLKNLNRKFVIYSIISGLILGLGYLVQTVGLKYTSTSTSSLLENVYLIVVPFASWIIAKKRPNTMSFICILGALIGVVLISYYDLAEIKSSSSLGIVLSSAAGFFYGINIALTGILFLDKDPVVFTFIQLATMTFLALIYYLIFERSVPVFDLKSVLSLLYLGILCSCVAWILRNFAQNHLSPNRISIILAFTSVVAVTISVVIGETKINIFVVIGAILILASVILDSASRYFRHKKEENEIKTNT